MNKLAKFIFPITAACCLFTGCSPNPIAEKPDIIAPNGTYTYTYEDGSKSYIHLEDDTFRIENGDYQSCTTACVIDRISLAQQEAASKALTLSEDEEQAIIDECKKIDFTMYDGQTIKYIREQHKDGNFMNIVAHDESGKEILGLFITYYQDDGTLGFGDGYYVLEK